jgi:LmbE family N-acetylglucosaminyl deacetylase
MQHWMSRSIFACLAVVFLTQCSDQAPDRSPQRTPVLLAIFAHPDDEASVAPVLAKYAAAGVRVHLAVATDGSLGVTEHAAIAAGDELAAIRRRELQCAASQLGLQPPMVLDLQDQMQMAEGLAAHSAQINGLRERVRGLFTGLQPDAVITWPSSGWTGHPDHLIVSAVVTEVFQSQRWERPTRLFYPAIPSGQLPPSHPFAAAAMDPAFLSTQITVSDTDYALAKRAWLCHTSQYTPAQVEQLHQTMLTTQKGIAHFQAVEPTVRKSKSLMRATNR